MSGKVVEKNTAVEEKPGLINMSCYEKGTSYLSTISQFLVLFQTNTLSKIYRLVIQGRIK